MSKNIVTPAEFFNPARQEAALALIACPGAEELTNLVDQHLVNWGKEVGIQKDTFIVPCDCPRFQSGDAKGLVKESVRGYDVFLVVDPGNYALTYNLFGHENYMSPDDHFANLKRLIQAVAGRAHRVTVIMPNLYGGRQHRRIVRESLDCAVALQELQAMGVNIGYVTLHVGLGTFRPVKADKIEDHKMHSEHYHLPKETAELINKTKAEGGRVIAVGTTSCRTLESAATFCGEIREDDRFTDIFIYPGYKFKCIDGLLTNFHLPESTLIMLVSALYGYDKTLSAYKVAVDEKYRFFSFGDCMLIK